MQPRSEPAIKDQPSVEETVKLGVKNSDNGKAQSAQVVSITKTKSPNMSSIANPQLDQLPKMLGVNILTEVKTIKDVAVKLDQMGLRIHYLLHFAQGSDQIAVLLYCISIHGQYVMIEAPPNIKVEGGTLAINYQRVGVLPTNVIDQFAAELSSIYTGYAYICGGGIHYSRSSKQEPVYYGYDDYKMAKAVFDIKKYHYILVPAVSFANLIEPARLNTIEAYINAVSQDDILKQAMHKAGLESFFTMKGPFTIFMPTSSKLIELLNLDPDNLKAVILAHVVVGRIESTSTPADKSKQIRDSNNQEALIDPNSLPVLGSETLELTAIAQNKITVQKVNGVIVKVSSNSNNTNSRSSSVKAGVKKYNGIIYFIDTVFDPVSITFKMPERSDIDDVVTVFDISRSTMEIRRAQYSINKKNQENMFEILKNISLMATVLNNEILEKSYVEGQSLLDHSSLLLRLFYSREVPCNTLCEEMDQVAEVVKTENEKFETLLRVSNRLAAMKIPLEKVLLKLARMDQKLHVKEENPYEDPK